MRKLICILLFSTLLALAACGGSGNTSSPESSETSPTILPEPISVVYNGLTITVYPRMELLSIVQFIGDNPNVNWGFMTRFFTYYKHDINTVFRYFDQHPAVRFYDGIFVGDFSFEVSEFPLIILFMNDDFSLDRVAFDETLSEKV